MVRMRPYILLLLFVCNCAYAELYKSVDANGNVVYSDRPAHAEQKPEQRKSANVASPEVTRQIKEEKAEMLRRHKEEEIAAQRSRAVTYNRARK